MQIEVTGGAEQILRRLVETGRYASAEDAVLALVNDLVEGDADHGDAAASNGAVAVVPPSRDADWQRAWECLLAKAKPRNPNVDDSRESIYPVR